MDRPDRLWVADITYGRCREAGGATVDGFGRGLLRQCNVRELLRDARGARLIERRSFRYHAEARMATFDFIEGWYNPRRRHSAIDYCSPIQFERRYYRDA